MANDALAVRVSRKGPVASVTLNRPEAGNAIDMDMARGLFDAATLCDHDPTIRAVLLRAEGARFCVGGDLSSIASASQAAGGCVKLLTTQIHAAISVFTRMNKPLVTEVRGAAAGAGLGLAILGDIVLASPSAQFTTAYAGVGLSADGGTSWLLPRLVGLRRAQEMFMTNRRVQATEAAEIGLITRVVADDILSEEAASIASRLASGPTLTYGSVRSLLLGSFTSTLETHLELEGRGIATAAMTADGQEGVAAFLAKRDPCFTG
jgi:2-(1,2-epoxy-1,2-dihydrophenyl)acetyl-CoA isomerase